MERQHVRTCGHDDNTTEANKSRQRQVDSCQRSGNSSALTAGAGPRSLKLLHSGGDGVATQ